MRIPVELGLLLLYIHKGIPKDMTFEGLNFDIIMGLTAVPVCYFAFIKQSLNRNLQIGWHLLGLVMLSIIFTIAILSAPFPLQQINFDQPNVAVLYFPYSLLPTVIVPSAVFAHVIALRRLLVS